MGIELPRELADVAEEAGVVWPQADEEAMARQAQAWRDAAADLSTLATDADTTARTALASTSGPAADAASAEWKTFVEPDSGHLTSVVRDCNAAADRLEHAANQVGTAKVEIVRNLVGLAQNKDAAHAAASAGHPFALAGLDTAVRGTAANVAHIESQLVTAVQPGTGVDLTNLHNPVNANPGHVLPATTDAVAHTATTLTNAATTTTNDVLPGGAHPGTAVPGPLDDGLPHPSAVLPGVQPGTVVPSLPGDTLPRPGDAVPGLPGEVVPGLPGHGLSGGAPAQPGEVVPGQPGHGLPGGAPANPGNAVPGLPATPGDSLPGVDPDITGPVPVTLPDDTPTPPTGQTVQAGFAGGLEPAAAAAPPLPPAAAPHIPAPAYGTPHLPGGPPFPGAPVGTPTPGIPAGGAPPAAGARPPAPVPAAGALPAPAARPPVPVPAAGALPAPAARPPAPVPAAGVSPAPAAHPPAPGGGGAPAPGGPAPVGNALPAARPPLSPAAGAPFETTSDRQPMAGPPGAPPPAKGERNEALAAFWIHMFPIGHLPVASYRPARQLPPPPPELDYAAGLRFEPADHPQSGLVDPTRRLAELKAADAERQAAKAAADAAPVPLPPSYPAPTAAPEPDTVPRLRPVTASAGLTADHPTVQAMLDGHDPLGDINERDWDRRYLVRLGSVTAQGISPEGLEYNWPTSEQYPEGGSAPGEPEVLAEDTVIDRFGAPDGRVFGQDGTPFAQRSLPPAHRDSGYRRYRVTRPLPVWRAVSAAWFGQPGGGVRYRTTHSATELVALGYLEEIA